MQKSKPGLRIQFLLYLVAIHLVLAVFAWYLLQPERQWFLLAEGLLVISFLLGVYLVQAILRPLQSLLMGITALREQDFSVKFRQVGQPEIDQLITVYNQLIERLREERLQAVERHFLLDKLLEASPIAVIMLDFDRKITSFNPAAARMLGSVATSCIGQEMTQVSHPLMPYLENLPDGESITIQLPGAHTFKLQHNHFLDRGFSRPFFLIEELTAEVLAAEKKAYGKVIRMMAHEINNSIGAINSVLESTRDHLTDSGDMVYAGALQVAHERNLHLAGFMRRFADVVRLPEPQREWQYLVPSLQQVIRIWQSVAAEQGVDLQFEPPDPPTVMVFADISQLEQVLINVFKNALEACSAGNTIKVTLTSTGLRIGNNGEPLPPEIGNQLFSPFYSTKAAGQGIGLTLSRDILTNHGWTFNLTTQPDGWTVFSIDFRV